MLVMTPEHAGALTYRGKELLEGLRKGGGWMSRIQLARASGKNILSPHDKILLERLIEAGYVEIRERKSNTPVGMAYEYRAK